RTRDLEAQALRTGLANISFDACLEIGCGTGKNTIWLMGKADRVTAVDLSGNMLAIAKEKINTPKVQFVQADITRPWTFRDGLYDLVSFSLVLEHIEDLGPIFAEAARSLRPGGYVYVGELHPFKQYTGTKARFDTEEGRQVVDCYTHNISDFIQLARGQGLALLDANEYFDDDDRNEIPRILTLLFKKTGA
ncbi:MAG: methyltransferase domain-containing protein, partial [Bacteroidetes bacterium]|nr:methyltransferase domain-containing protein [Bacteroidota bacterium]